MRYRRFLINKNLNFIKNFIEQEFEFCYVSKSLIYEIYLKLGGTDNRLSFNYYFFKHYGYETYTGKYLRDNNIEDCNIIKSSTNKKLDTYIKVDEH